jgi:ribosomal-protein-alanine N-acetyltransferase
MGPFPLETRRLLLREFRDSDETAIHEYAQDREVTRYTDFGPNTIEQTRAFLQTCLASQERWPRESISLAIELKLETRLIGGIGFVNIDSDMRTGKFGYVLHRAYWGKGFATEAASALLNFGFEILFLHRIVALCDVRNGASSHVLEKLGMRCEAHFRKDAKKQANGAIPTFSHSWTRSGKTTTRSEAQGAPCGR